MEFTAAVAADLALLSGALDAGDGNIADALRQLAADARAAVPSYLGLTVIASRPTAFTLTALEPAARPQDVVTSLLVPLPDGTAGIAELPIVVILYAARAGAFVDQAADLAWLTGRPLIDFPIDGHLVLPAQSHHDGDLREASVVNQAIGVLIGHGYPPEQAELEIGVRAAAGGRTLVQAAEEILAGVRPADPDSDVEH